MEGERHKHQGADQAEEGEQGQDTEMTDVWDAFVAVDGRRRRDRKEWFMQDLFGRR